MASGPAFPSSCASTSAEARLPTPLFILAFCQSIRRRGLPTPSPRPPRPTNRDSRPRGTPAPGGGHSESGLLNGVGRGDLSTHRGSAVGSCSSTVLGAARGSHLGVTVSPHAPYPADFVTGSGTDPSPPLGLTPSRRRGWAGPRVRPAFDVHSWNNGSYTVIRWAYQILGRSATRHCGASAESGAPPPPPPGTGAVAGHCTPGP